MKVWLIEIFEMEPYSENFYHEVYATKELVEKAYRSPPWKDENGVEWAYGYFQELEVNGL